MKVFTPSIPSAPAKPCPSVVGRAASADMPVMLNLELFLGGIRGGGVLLQEVNGVIL